MRFGPDEFIVAMWGFVGFATFCYFFYRKAPVESGPPPEKVTVVPENLPLVTIFFNSLTNEVDNPDDAKTQETTKKSLKSLGAYYRVVLIVHANSDEEEELYKKKFIDDLAPDFLPEHNIVFCRKPQSRVAIISQLRPFAHLDWENHIFETVKKRVSNCILINKEFPHTDPITPTSKGSQTFDDATRLLCESRLLLQH